ncbi:MAG: ribosome maturation factor RimM, partial [Spirochaetota bacterium]
MANELVIGRVRTAHGVRGELKVEPLSRETRHFRGLREVTMIRGDRRERVEIESVREAHRVVLVKLVGVDSPEEAKKWRGWEMAVPRELAAPLQEDEYYFADLVGLRVIFESSDVGVVRDLWEGGE